MLPPFVLLPKWQAFPTAPTISFATPGDLAVVYTGTGQVGSFCKVGGICFGQIEIVTSTFTHTTASGNLEISGLPFTVANTNDLAQGMGSFQGITKANYTQFALRPAANTTRCVIDASGSGQARSTVTAANMPTGGHSGTGVVVLVFSFAYRIA